MSNKKLRMSDVTKSNDSHEIYYSFPIIERTFMDAYKAEKAKYFVETVSCEMFECSIKNWMENLQNDIPICYVICFSSEKDLLSQWRGYAEDGKGVSFGIDKSKLDRWSKMQGIRLQKVEYNKNQQRKRLRILANNIIKSIKTEIKNNTEMNQDELLKVFNGYKKELLTMIVGFKDSFFKEEKEWRLFIYEDDVKDEVKKSYIVTDNLLKSYIEYGLEPILEMEGEGVLVILGPNNLSSINDMEKYLLEMNRDNKVLQSKGTYRKY